MSKARKYTLILLIGVLFILSSGCSMRGINQDDVVCFEVTKSLRIENNEGAVVGELYPGCVLAVSPSLGIGNPKSVKDFRILLHGGGGGIRRIDLGSENSEFIEVREGQFLPGLYWLRE